MAKSGQNLCKLCQLPTKYRVPIKDMVFCPSCYYSHFASLCEVCDKKIKLDEESVDWKGMAWHQNCFLCHQCKQPVTSKPFFYEKHRVLMCANCCKKYVISNFNCTGCGKKILVDEQTVAIEMEPYHQKCFKCSFCGGNIDLNNYEKKGDRLQCYACKLKSTPRCKECSKPILSGMVKFNQSNYHRKCLRCGDCGKHVQERIVRQNMALKCMKCFDSNDEAQKNAQKTSKASPMGSKDEDDDGRGSKKRKSRKNKSSETKSKENQGGKSSKDKKSETKSSEDKKSGTKSSEDKKSETKSSEDKKSEVKSSSKEEKGHGKRVEKKS